MSSSRTEYSWTGLSKEERDRWTLPELLRDRAQSMGNRPFLSIKDGPVETFAEILDRSETTARKISTLGVAPGDRVLLMSVNSLEQVHAWFGINLLGAADVPLNTAYRSHTLAHGVNLASARVMIMDPDFIPLLREIEDDLTSLEVVVSLFPTDVRLHRIQVISMDELIADTTLVWPDVQPSDIASVILTSGTTGPAKGVLLAHAYCQINAIQCIDGMRITEDDVMYCFHPLFHMTGQFCAVWSCLAAGCRLVLDRSFDAPTWIDSVRKYEATVTIGHGPMLEMIQAQPERPDDADNKLRVVLAAPLPVSIGPAFQRRFQTRGMEIWGMTEVSCVSWPPYDAEQRLGTAGVPRNDLFDIAIIDPVTDEILPEGVVGEITVRPKFPWTIMQGYLGMPEKTNEAWRNLRFHTGDAGLLDKDGYLTFVDRLGDRIRRRAENISSYDIEVAATSHPHIAESAAVGVPSDFDSDDDIKLCIVASEGVTLDSSEVFEHLVSNLPHYMVPRYVAVLPQLPRSATNKVQKQRLRDMDIDDSVWDRQALGISVGKLREKMDKVSNG